MHYKHGIDLDDTPLMLPTRKRRARNPNAKPHGGELAGMTRTQLDKVMTSEREIAKFIRKNSRFIYRAINAAHIRRGKALDFEEYGGDMYSVALAAIWRGMQRFDDRVATLSTYLFTVIVRDVLRWYDEQLRFGVMHKSIETMRFGDEDDGGEYDERKFRGTFTPPEQHFAQKVETELAWAQMTGMFSDFEFHIVSRLYVDGVPQRQVAVELNVSRRWLQEKLHAGIQRKYANIIRDLKEDEQRR